MLGFTASLQVFRNFLFNGCWRFSYAYDGVFSFYHVDIATSNGAVIKHFFILFLKKIVGYN